MLQNNTLLALPSILARLWQGHSTQKLPKAPGQTAGRRGSAAQQGPRPSTTPTRTLRNHAPVLPLLQRQPTLPRATPEGVIVAENVYFSPDRCAVLMRGAKHTLLAERCTNTMRVPHACCIVASAPPPNLMRMLRRMQSPIKRTYWDVWGWGQRFRGSFCRQVDAACAAHHALSGARPRLSLPLNSTAECLAEALM